MITVQSDSKTIDYCLIEDVGTLVWAANLAAVELHVPLARAERPDRPTAMIFDLDPGPPAGLLDCARLALELRDALQGVGLQSLAKVSGGKGLHVVVPLDGTADFDVTRSFAKAVATLFARKQPNRVTATMNKTTRAGRVYIDWLQNDPHKTTVCAYSLRAMDRPTVSAPVSWQELAYAAKANTSHLAFCAGDMIKRVKKDGDLFTAALELKQKLPSYGG
jgi:bifunctional non-homologous end joining protein LigD